MPAVTRISSNYSLKTELMLILSIKLVWPKCIHLSATNHTPTCVSILSLSPYLSHLTNHTIHTPFLDTSFVVQTPGNTPLRTATELGFQNIVECLLAAYADVNIADVVGLTPLHVACSGWHVAMVRLLLSRGAKVDAADSNGRTALHVICDRWYPEIAELLCDNGASVDAVDSSGNTPLLSACEGGKSVVARWFIDHQANINARNKDGRTPLLVSLNEIRPKATTKSFAFTIKDDQLQALELGGSTAGGIEPNTLSGMCGCFLSLYLLSMLLFDETLA